MAYLNIITRLKADLENVSGIGNVYELKKSVHDEQEKSRLFKASSKLHVWFTGRDSEEAITDYNTLVVRQNIFVIEGYYAFKQSTETEKTFQALIDDILNELTNDRLLGGYGYVIKSPSTPEIDEVMFCDVLCNHVKIDLLILTTHEAGEKDMVYTGTETFLTSAARTSSSTSDAKDVEKYIEGTFYINVTAVSGDGAQMRCFAQKSPDNVTYYDFYEFPIAVTETGQYFFPVENFGKYLKFKYVISGPSASFTFTATFEGKNPYGI